MEFGVRQKSLKLLWLEALQRRLVEGDWEADYYAEQYRRLDAGFAGEKRVDREWQEIICPNTFFIMHNLIFYNAANHSHQVDTLFICSHFMLIIEIKNISGRLDFDETTHQCTRTKADGVVEGFPNPITQIQRHAQFFDTIPQKRSLPSECAIIFSNPSAIIGRHPNTIPILHVAGLQQHLNALFKKYPNPHLTDEYVNNFVQTLRDRHHPQVVPTKIVPSRFRHGVLCPNCRYKRQMVHLRGTWSCPSCNYKSAAIFAEALHDYRLLIGPTITNRQLRAFFGINSSDVATRLLKKFQFSSTGTYKNRVYFLPDNLLEYMKTFYE
ncbi:nuclease-related domain-containing protein [Lysinibacillus sp. NPDC097287]|uniref:nuclease-related domain-containing protein n=1 Tax=Lysinibacillus sp. NPDC097287 TaxID=3364144 RepID=UPI0037FD2EBF